MSEFNQNAVKQLNRIAAQKIFEKIRELRMSEEENSKRRWVWELLQNAKDKSAIDFPTEKVSIIINYDDHLEFQHNFGYFTVTNIEGLIRQISSEDKDREDASLEIRPQTTGRFGTGFITTHLLSEKVEVKGLYKKDISTFLKIAFPLDRSGRILSELINTIDNSLEFADQSVSNSDIISDPNFSDFNTTFIYQLDEKGRQIADIGLQDLESALPYTLTFIERIKSVKTTQDSQEIVYEKINSRSLTEKIKIIEFNKTINGNLEKLYYVYLSENLTSICLPVTINDNQITIQSFNQKLSRIFLDFPLIGTENFYFPVIINNPFLEPTEPRDGVYLTDKNESHVIHNKNIIKEAIFLYLILLEYASNHDWQSLYFLADTQLPQEKKWISTHWYRDNVQNILRENLMNSEIVYTDDLENPKIRIKDTLFPFNRSLEKTLNIWDFAKELWLDRLPKREHIQFWINLIDKTWPKEIQYGIDRLVSDIASLSSVDQLCDRINKTENETLIYLTKVIQFVNQENSKLLDNFAIIPNQYGDFKKKKELWLDDNIPNQLKEILSILGDDWRIQLKHNQISVDDLATTKTILDIINKINQIIREDKNPKIKTAVLHLISCSPPENKNISDIYQLRKQIWELSNDFYHDTPKQKYLGNWNKAIWQECDKWFIRQLFVDIAEKETIIKLNDHLEKNCYQWLSKLVNFVVEKNLLTNINDTKIIPDQQDNLQKFSDLFYDEGIDDTLKDILEDLGYNYRSQLINTSITLNTISIECLKIKSKNTKDIATEITERVQNILRSEISQSRTEKDKNIFQKLFLWLYENEDLAKQFFPQLHEKSYQLRTEEEIIRDIKFKQDILNNSNGYTEEEIHQLVNIPKDQLMVLPNNISQEEINKFIEELQKQKITTENQSIASPSDDLSPEELEQLLLSLAIDSPEELEKAQARFCGSYLGGCLARISRNYNFEYVQSIIARAKQNIRQYLNQKSEYDCTNWKEESITVISGIKKKDRPIKLVIRPSDGRKVYIHYDTEIVALESSDSELWIDDNQVQRILTLGQILRYTGIYYIKL